MTAVNEKYEKQFTLTSRGKSVNEKATYVLVKPDGTIIVKVRGEGRGRGEGRMRGYGEREGDGGCLFTLTSRGKPVNEKATYILYFTLVPLPSSLPSDLTLSLTLTSTLSDGQYFYTGSLALTLTLTFALTLTLTSTLSDGEYFYT